MTLRESQGNVSDPKKGLLSIRQFAQICRTTPRTLRFYEEKGLFQPTFIDQFTKYRYYHPQQAREFLRLRLLHNFHVPLKEISTSYKKKSAESFLDKELERIKKEIEEKEKEYRFLEKIKHLLFSDFLYKSHSGNPPAGRASRISPHPNPLPAGRGKGRRRGARMTKSTSLKAKTFGPYSLFCMIVEHGEYAKITDYIKTLWKEAKKLKLDCTGQEITFYLKDRYNPKDTPFEISLALKSTSQEPRSLPRHLRGDKKLPGQGEQANKNFYFKSYPKTKVLSYEYSGPYDYLILVYQKLYSYFEDNKIDLKGSVFETYKYGPLNTKSKYDYQMTIGFPV
jgi:DNA-binding transcriptional MerR regulator